MATSKCDEIIVDGSDLIKSIRIGVRMPRMLRVRMVIASWLFTLAGLVSGSNVVVEVNNEES